MNDFEQSKQMEEKNVIKKKIFNYIWIFVAYEVKF